MPRLSDRTIRSTLVVLMLVLQTGIAQAWNPSGHRTAASIIFRRLSEDRRMELAALLHDHPRYRADFLAAMPESLRDADPQAQAEWLLQQASYWPDIARGGPPERTAYDRPLWHYLPRAFYLSPPSNEFRAQVGSKFNSRLDPVGGTEVLDHNGPQALKANLDLLHDQDAPRAERAVALCWVLHVGQDLHQPCHTASLCSPGAFPEGDRGANFIRTEPLRNLHAVWDSPLGPDDRYEACRNLAIVMLGNAGAELDGLTVGSIDDEVKLWMQEGLELSASAVYINEVREAVSGEREPAVIQLTEDYLRNVRKVSDRRLLLAGVRLGQLLERDKGR